MHPPEYRPQGPAPEPSASTTVGIVSSALREAQSIVGKSGYETFEQFTRLSYAALNHADETLWKEMKLGWEPAFPLFQKALGELMLSAQRLPYRDMIGPVYMQLGQADKTFGQFFTPWTVAQTLARVNLADLDLSVFNPHSPLRALDPACGSGTLLLALAAELPASMVDSRSVRLLGIDIDPLCVEMTRLNLQLHGLGVVSRARLLSANQWQEVFPDQYVLLHK